MLGTIIQQSLEDKEILNEFKIIKIKPAGEWLIYFVEGEPEAIRTLTKVLKKGKWYAHFWDDERNIHAVFRDQVFDFNFDDKKSWEPVIKYGLSLGIPKEQLDFPIEILR